MAWENRNYVYDKLLEHLGERAHIRHDQFKQLELINGIFITVYPRNDGADIGLTYYDYDTLTQTYSLDKTDKLFAEMEKAIKRLVRRKEKYDAKVRAIWKKSLGLK